MADALVSPAVGGAAWAASAGLIGYCSRRVRKELDEKRIPLMGVLGAFIFAAQMINFSIPGTGSSGHLGGGMILAILLGPYAGFLAIASVLVIQALFFADGGLLAMGCNILNLGLFPCFVAYPLIFKRIAGKSPSQGRLWAACTVASLAGLQLGAFAVVLETVLSGISELPFRTFVILMQPIHLAIGLVEGIVTAAVVNFVRAARPEILQSATGGCLAPEISLRRVLAGLLVTTAVIGGAVSWFASSHPDGLEWAIGETTGQAELDTPASGVHTSLAGVQEKTALLPDYGLPQVEAPAAEESGAEHWPAVDAGTTISGLVGGVLTLFVAGMAGHLLKHKRRRAAT